MGRSLDSGHGPGRMAGDDDDRARRGGPPRVVRPVGGRGARRARPRAAPGRDRAPGPGMRARGRGHRQDPRHHPPHRLRRAQRRLRAAACPHCDLHRPGGGRAADPAAEPGCVRRAGPHVPRGRVAPALVLLAADGGRLPTWAAGAQGVARRRCRGPAAAVRRPGRRPRPVRGDRVGEGHDAHAADVRVGGPPGRPRRTRRLRPAHRGAPAGGVRAGQDRPWRDRLRGRAAPHRRRPAGVPPRRGGRPQPVPALRRRRVPGRERPAAAPARPLAGRPGRRLRRRRSQPDHLLLHRRLAGPPARVPSPAPGRDRGAPRPRLPVHATGGRPGQRLAREGRHGPVGARPAGARRSAAARPGAPADGVRRRPRGGRGDRSDRATSARGGHPGERDRRPLPHERPVRAPGAGTRRRRRALPGAGRRAVLQPQGGARRDPAAARCGARRGRRGRRRARSAADGRAGRPCHARVVRAAPCRSGRRP